MTRQPSSKEDDLWASVEAAIGCSVPDEVREHIIDCTYRDPLEPAMEAVRQSRTAKALKELTQRAAALADYLDDALNEDSEDPEKFARTLVMQQITGLTGFDDLLCDLRLLEKAAKAEIENLPETKGGRPVVNAFLLSYIDDLADAYEFVTGETPTPTKSPITGEYSGKFFTFVDLLTHFLLPEEHHKENVALGAAVVRRLNLRKVMRGSGLKL